MGTLSDMIARVRDNVCDPTSARWADSTITAFLNDAQIRLAQMSRTPTARSVVVPAGTSYVIKPSDLLVPKNAFFEQGSDIYLLDIRQGMPTDPISMAGIPDTLYILDAMLHIRPVPGQDGVLDLEGIGRPTPLVNPTDTTTLEDADSVLVAYATWMCFMADGDPAAAGWKQIYEQIKQEWAILDAQKNPMPRHIGIDWWVQND